MEYNTKRTSKYRELKKMQWCRWFAWYPVTIKDYPDGSKKKIWLKRVWKRAKLFSNFGRICWEYEKIEKGYYGV